MKLKLSLAKKESLSDITTINIQGNNALDFIRDEIAEYFEGSEGGVYVIFQNFYPSEHEDDFYGEQSRILLTTDTYGIDTECIWFKDSISELASYTIDIVVFEYESWEEAIRFCKDLREGM